MPLLCFNVFFITFFIETLDSGSRICILLGCEATCPNPGYGGNIKGIMDTGAYLVLRTSSN